MSPSLTGIHHVTAITADAQKNIDFYCGVLGLRLVKLTVNFDDPGSYHLYYGDELGRPGTIMTFFAWPGAERGRAGPPQVTTTAFAVPHDAIDYWMRRLEDHNVGEVAASERFGERVLQFEDPDGIRLEIGSVADPAGRPWAGGPVPIEFAIRGFHGVTLTQRRAEETATLLTDGMGYELVGREQGRSRYRAGASADGLAAMLDIVTAPSVRHGTMGAGIVHHVAFRTPDDVQHAQWLKRISGLGLNASPIIDRSYFHSIYYREPGGVLFEIATDNPGFTVDEPADQLGSALRLPSQFEPYRGQIERALPPVHPPLATARNG